MIVFFLKIIIEIIRQIKKAPIFLVLFLLNSKGKIYLLELEFLFSFGFEFLGVLSLFCRTLGVFDSD